MFSRANLAIFLLAAPASAQFCDSELFAITPTLQSQFGATLSVSPDQQFLAVGSPFGIGSAGCPSGTVNVYTRAGSAWVSLVELESPNPECDGQFGYDVSLENNRLVVGAPFEDVGGTVDAGRTYVYSLSGGTWALAQTLTEINAFPQSRFGHSVSVDGVRIAVSAIRSAFFGPSAGAVYVYRRSSGQYLFEDRLAPTPAQPGAFFGTSVAVSGTNCIVGAAWNPASPS